MAITIPYNIARSAMRVLALLMSFGIMSIISNVQDILAIRQNGIHIINNYG